MKTKHQPQTTETASKGYANNLI